MTVSASGDITNTPVSATALGHYFSPNPVPVLSFVVTNTNDSGTGSLRQVILNANQVGGHSITFAIPGVAGAVRTIAPLSVLPVITGPSPVNGTSQGVFDRQTVASPLIQVNGRNAGPGGRGARLRADVRRQPAHLDLGLRLPRQPGRARFGRRHDPGQYLGLPADPSTPTGFVSGADGLLIKAGVEVIGGPVPSQRNVISGNLVHGIEFSGPAATHGMVIGNFIGTDPLGSAALANGLFGIVIANGAPRMSPSGRAT